MPKASYVIVYEKIGGKGWKKMGTLKKSYYYTFTRNRGRKYSYRIKSYYKSGSLTAKSDYTSVKSIRL